MRENRPFARILLKLSGEALKGAEPYGICFKAVDRVASLIQEVSASGTQMALVLGAGNLFRGLPASRRGLSRNTADYMGMQATVINALALQDALESVGVVTLIQTPFAMPGVTDCFDHKRARAALEQRHVVIFAGGTGHPFFTTDTTAALRACEIGADALFKATKVDGVYSDDPKLNPEARRYRTLAYRDALQQRLGVMDATAFSLCMENSMPIVVFNFSDARNLKESCAGNLEHATVVNDGPTEED